VLRHNLFCGEIGQSEPSLMTHFIALLKYWIITRRTITVLDYTVRKDVRFVGGDPFVEILMW
jgi:hypothetical protein